MIELLAAATVLFKSTDYPAVWANNYCIYRGLYDMTHEEATAAATAAKQGGGDPTEEALALVADPEFSLWCPQVEETE